MECLKRHIHPKDSTKTIFGRKLEAGDQVEIGDYFAAACGDWVQTLSRGKVLGEGLTVYWVRRENTEGVIKC